jgi:hypothetical protein
MRKVNQPDVPGSKYRSYSPARVLVMLGAARPSANGRPLLAENLIRSGNVGPSGIMAQTPQEI